jgi:putative ABC transport system substrate-binding protein
MNRREFVTLLGGATGWPLAARAQQQRAIPRIGLVSIGADPANPVIFLPFLQQLRELGYIEGRNIILEKRFAAGQAVRRRGHPPVLTSPNPLSTLQKQFACARLSRPCLPGS